MNPEVVRRINDKQSRPEGALHTVRWVMAHEPPVVFEDASEAFAQLVREKSNGEIDVELFLADDYAAYRNVDSVSRRQLIDDVAKGEVEMAHCYVASLGQVHDPLWAVELPFLFKDYAHGERFFQSEWAEQLMAGMRSQGLRGLSFAYSGGYRIVPSRGRTLEALGDFEGLRVRTAGNPVAARLYEKLGATTIGADLSAIPGLVERGEIDACEITSVRFEASGLRKHFDTVNDTAHSLFTTMMVANETWLSKLSDEHQAVITDAAKTSCAIEREVAIREESKAKAEHIASMNVATLNTDAKAKLEAIGRELQDEFAPRFGQDIVEGIRGC